MVDDLYGAGLDIDGWNYLKHDQSRNVNDLIDKSHVHRQMFPLLLRSDLTKEEHQDVHDIVISTLETRSHIDPSWIGESVVTGLNWLYPVMARKDELKHSIVLMVLGMHIEPLATSTRHGSVYVSAVPGSNWL